MLERIKNITSLKGFQFTNRIINGNCIDVMKKMPAESVDLVIADPPYLVNYRDSDGRSFANDDWKNAYWLRPAFAEIYRVLKKDSVCISFYGFTQAEKFLWAWKKAGFKIADNIVWLKTYMSSRGFVGRYHESAYLLVKGNPPKPGINLPSILSWRYSGNKLHPTQKPVSAISPLIEAFSNPGEIVLDPFIGSGTTAMAAKMTGRKYIGIEISPKYCQIAQKRLSK